MKSLASTLATLLLLTGCATAQRPVQVMEVCPVVPMLELDAPERDWQGQMQLFLQGLLPMQPDYSLRSTPASPTQERSNGR